MPWKESTPTNERLRFVQDVHRPGWSIAEPCRRYGVSRKTGYKWLAAYAQAGPAALVDGSHRPTTCPHASPAKIIALILQMQRRYTWGTRKVRRLLLDRVSARDVPTKTTIHRILERHGRVQPRRRVGGGSIRDRLRRRWTNRLGIRPDLIEPAHPEQNGRHERMHKTLKAATARPPQRDLGAQQRAFDAFRRRYNAVRPHEALDDATPASGYTASLRPYPSTLPALEYPGHYERRLVSRNGGIRWNHEWVNVSHLLAELDIGLEEIDDGLWNVYFGPVWLGRFHEAVGRIIDQLKPPGPSPWRESPGGAESVTHHLSTQCYLSLGPFSSRQSRPRGPSLARR